MPVRNRSTPYLLLFLAVLVTYLGWYQLKPSQTYKAPFPRKGEKIPNLIPDTYSIILFPGHTIEDLGAAIGRDMQPFVERVIKIPPSLNNPPEEVMFTVEGVDEKLLETIRTYRGVQLVEYSAWYFPNVNMDPE